jgi:hypothetical protein
MSQHFSQLSRKRNSKRSGITHAPTIGAQYEGITGSTLRMMIPPELELQVVAGFVEGIESTLSGQIDCMLVRGTGIPIPGLEGGISGPCGSGSQEDAVWNRPRRRP